MYDIDLRDLRWAVIASQSNSLHRAAEIIGIRQSTLSRRLRDLECQLDTALFERSRKGTRPTAAGLVFLENARLILTQIDETISAVKSHSRGQMGRMTIGICTSFSTGNLHATLADYRRRFPEIEVRTVDRLHERLISDVDAGRIDVAIVIGDRLGNSSHRLSLWMERAVVALPESHALSSRQFVRWEELADERLIVSSREPGPEFQRFLAAKLDIFRDGRFVEHDIGLDRLLSLVGAGFGITFIPEGATGREPFIGG